MNFLLKFVVYFGAITVASETVLAKNCGLRNASGYGFFVLGKM